MIATAVLCTKAMLLRAALKTLLPNTHMQINALRPTCTYSSYIKLYRQRYCRSNSFTKSIEHPLLL